MTKKIVFRILSFNFFVLIVLSVFMIQAQQGPIYVDISQNQSTIHFCTLFYDSDETPVWRAHVIVYSEPSQKILYAATEGIVPDSCTYSIPRSDIPLTDTKIHINITNTDDNRVYQFSADIISFDQTIIPSSVQSNITEATSIVEETITTTESSAFSFTQTDQNQELSFLNFPIILGLSFTFILIKKLKKS